MKKRVPSIDLDDVRASLDEELAYRSRLETGTMQARRTDARIALYRRILADAGEFPCSE